MGKRDNRSHSQGHAGKSNNNNRNVSRKDGEFRGRTGGKPDRNNNRGGAHKKFDRNQSRDRPNHQNRGQNRDRNQNRNEIQRKGRPHTKEERLARQNKGRDQSQENRSKTPNQNGDHNQNKSNNKFKKQVQSQNIQKSEKIQKSERIPKSENIQKSQNRQNKGINLKTQKKNKANGQYSEYVGKSLFKIIPEGQDEGEDKFAALNGGEQEQDNQYEVEMDQNPNQQFEGDEEMEQQNGEQMDEEQFDEEGEEQELNEQEQEADDDDDDEEQDEQVDENQQVEQGNEQQYEYEPESDEEQNQGEQKGEQNEQEGQQMPMMDDDEEDQNVDISVINLRIQQIIQVLMNVGKLGQGKPRKHYVQKLKGYLHRYYGYNFELIDHFLNFLNPTEMVQFFEANETHRPLTIRTNTLKTRRKQLAQSLIQRGVNLDPLAEWSKVGIKIYDTKVPVGATPEYLAGHYMLQSGSSFLPVLALDPQMNEKILDMASAPGGKTSYIAQIMKNTGSIFANDLKKDRLKALQFNIFRLGISNTVVTCRDGRKYPSIFPNTFDRVLLDAPCTGLGIISKDHSIKANRSLLDIYKNSHVQKQLLLAAIDCTKVGGVIVYSTCSVSPLQNEEVINYALKKRYVKIVDIDNLVEVGTEGLIKFIDKRYHVDLKKTKRIYPHIHNMDGFYLGKLVKTANGKRQSAKQEEQSKQE